ncbi:hypothetical protein PAAG_11552 [Paracoccidioides lutzii Pb01]|uniref:Uncharacterized protein n=1 Tax=Paracoccidioides lutzii (strain ATCC MYA-826 / Pb01) TaxID=502779 RepID=A0A0A2V1R7_PARBA|nr:hypothetical protein PAAG_11552 [Paracoccidioides lutzii Pb01]KGQ01706.1 hypothetical protein PAAG_11552 [Paracoccidioides lutzii Pb01]
MASTSFRDSMNSLGWARREPETAPTNRSSNSIFSSLQSLNPFADRGYIQLPAQDGPGAPLPLPTRREEEEAWFACESHDLFFIKTVESISCHLYGQGASDTPQFLRPHGLT